MLTKLEFDYLLCGVQAPSIVFSVHPQLQTYVIDSARFLCKYDFLYCNCDMLQECDHTNYQGMTWDGAQYHCDRCGASADC
jgi:hypothetical protein